MLPAYTLSYITGFIVDEGDVTNILYFWNYWFYSKVIAI